MRVDGTVMTAKPEEMPAAARELEELGYDGVFTAETSHAPFLPSALAALETEIQSNLQSSALVFGAIESKQKGAPVRVQDFIKSFG